MAIEKYMIAGALEYCDLPELNVNEIQARVDTGAATSSLHVDNIREFTKDEKRCK